MKTQKRRRKEQKTDYKARLALLKSGKKRLVIRKTNRYIIVQLIDSKLAQDRVLKSASSKDLLKKGWPKEKSGSLKSLTAAYLTGYLRAKSLKNKEEAVLDIGLHRNVRASRIYAALKGAIDGGLNVKFNETILPSESRIASDNNKADLIKKIKEKI